MRKILGPCFVIQLSVIRRHAKILRVDKAIVWANGLIADIDAADGR